MRLLPRLLLLPPPLLLLLLCRPAAAAAGGSTQLPRFGRSPRQVQLTAGAQARGELVLWMPLTIILSSLGYPSHDTAADREQRQQSREQRAGAGQAPPVGRPPYDSTAVEYRASAVGPLLSRLDAYFHFLRVPDARCRRRVVCQLARHPAAFEPVSSLVLRALRKSDSYQRRSAGRPGERRFSQYYEAAARGAAGADCQRAYAGCAAAAERLINMPVLRLWQLLSELVSMRVTDD
ncbi:uncharacterized protein LOC119110300 [Pollicipes pollicipes]|uniref:uncharacterized protein LOC119110300 n=1 Tax=Pollicipes pollicipes TaxID=41117 RepID=UPI001884BCE5|nr:uncharacterized protein LOC119110300 [Pollicipes pollicipes]